MPDVQLRATVIVPAHNEGERLPSLLADLVSQDSIGLDIRVSCNGCTDQTAAAARAWTPAARERGHRLLVLDHPHRSKPAALRAAEDSGPLEEVLFWLDADIRVPAGTLQECAQRLLETHSAGGLRPTMRPGGSLLVNSYFHTWKVLHANRVCVGAGFLGAHRDARASWGPVPELVADDLWFLSHVDSGPGFISEEARFEITPPKSLWDLLQMRSRWARGNRESCLDSRQGPGLGALLAAAIRTPLGLLIFLSVNLLAGWSARSHRGLGTAVWERARS
ncbi:MAG: glycosyltransferase family 2 protein [Planctomycetes bacterium]|nr:glycosyltransferase family 2 protein [Planctomycetota bacterium]